MAIVKMKGLRLLAMRSDREALLELLQGMGCVEIDEPNQDPQTWQGLLSQLGGETLSRPDGQALSQAREDLQAAQRALAVLKRHGDKGRGLLAPRPQLTQQQLFDGEEQGKQAVDQVLEADRHLAALEAQHSKLLTQRAALAPWLELNIPLDTASTQEMVVQFGTVTAGVELEQVQRAVEGASELAQLTQASVDRDVRYCLLVCHASAQEEVLQALRDFGWSRMNLSGWTGTAKENDQRITQELEQNEQQTAQAEQQLSQLTSLAEPIRQAADPITLYNEPENLFAAGFIGTPPMNFLEVVSDGQGRFVSPAGTLLPPAGLFPSLPKGRRVLFGVRPENLIAETVPTAEPGTLAATADIIEQMGAEAYVHFRVAEARMTARTAPDWPIRHGDLRHIRPAYIHTHLFDPESGRRLD